MSYVIKAQGYDPGPTFTTKTEAVKAVRVQVQVAMKDCRQKFGTAFLKKWKDEVWTVQATSDDHSPMWARYSIHKC